MKKLILFFALSFLCIGLTGCPGSSGTNPILTPIQDVGCAVESAITGGFGSLVVAQCGGTNTAACGAAFQSALGNVNLCTTPLPQATAQAAVAKDATGGWKTVGDIPASALSTPGVQSKAVKPMGIVGGIACPIAVNTVMGVLTAQIPAACGCTTNLSASAISGLLTQACVAAIPL